MKHIARFLLDPTEFLKEDHNQKVVILGIFIVLFLCLLILLVRGTSQYHEAVLNSNDSAASPLPITFTITPTKWWIKMAATSYPVLAGVTKPVNTAEVAASNCSTRFSASLKVGIYAYVSLTPPLPNRLRSDARLSGHYLGQIGPGSGLKLIDGPICADGYSWWLVESLQGGLRGWTVEGKGSEHWVVPCPNEHVACSQTKAPISLTEKTTTDKNNDKQQSNCRSDKFTIGMLAQVGQDSLLVLRSEPYTGRVNGRAGPMSIVKVIDGPACVGNVVWWKVSVLDLGRTGWTTETNLHACPKDSECNRGPF